MARMRERSVAEMIGYKQRIQRFVARVAAYTGGATQITKHTKKSTAA
jgi:hypothetical protein